MDPRRRALIWIMLFVGMSSSVATHAGDEGSSEQPARLSGTIRDAKGVPVVGAVVSVQDGDRTITLADGSYAISSISPGDTLVTASIVGRFRVETLLSVASGRNHHWDATIGAPGVIRGRIVDEYGHPLTSIPDRKDSGWMITAMPEQEWMRSGEGDNWRSATDAHGEFQLRVGPDALFRLQVRRADSSAFVLMTEPMSGGLRDVIISVPPASMPHGRIRCRLEDHEGRKLTDVLVQEVFLRHFLKTVLPSELIEAGDLPLKWGCHLL